MFVPGQALLKHYKLKTGLLSARLSILEGKEAPDRLSDEDYRVGVFKVNSPSVEDVRDVRELKEPNNRVELPLWR